MSHPFPSRPRGDRRRYSNGRLREPFFHGLRLWRWDADSWSADLWVVCALAVAIALVASLLDVFGGMVSRLVESPIPMGPWARSWSTGMLPPTVEQGHAVERLSATAEVVTALVGLLAAGTLAGAWAQHRRERQTRRHVSWKLGAARGQALAERAGEAVPFAAAVLACSFVAAAAIPAVIAATFPGTLLTGTDPALLLGLGFGLLAVAAVVGERAAIADARLGSPPLRPIAAALQTPAFLIGLGFAVASSAGLLLVHVDGLGLPLTVGPELEVVRASLVPDELEERATVLRQWLSALGDEQPPGMASTGTLRGLGVRDIAWVDCGACSSGNIATPIRVVRPEVYAVGPDTFPFLGVELVEGREWEAVPAGRFRSPEVIVSRRMARENFEGGRALGRRLRLGVITEEWSTVVGVVTDRADADREGDIAVYLPLETAVPSEIELVGPVGSNVLQRAEEAVPPGIDLQGRKSASSEYAARRWFATLLALLAASGLVLIIGAGRRAAVRDARLHHREVSIHRALGARRRDLVLLTARRIGWQIAAGLCLGVFLAVALGARLQDAVPDLPLFDARVWAVSGCLVLGATLTGFRSEFRHTMRATPAEGLGGPETVVG